jgi:hypothetical protein
MSFASDYLEKRTLFPRLILEAPDLKTGIIIVIPAFNEPDICSLFDSLIQCDKPDCSVEVIAVVNAPSNASDDNLKKNSLTIKNIESWKKQNSESFFRLFFFNAVSDVKDWGVGLARKTGMDEAVRRFETIENENGIILCLDADCTVDSNYLTEVHKAFSQNRNCDACSIYFEHPLSGTCQDDSIYRYITLYELHLRYLYQGMKYSRFPNAFHTVGSAMAVKALPYVKSGGMNRRQAGEDFYFIQKLVSAGGFFYLTSTKVCPSSRISDRVPFGTGAMINKLKGDDSQGFLTYNIQSYRDLLAFFKMTDTFSEINPEELAISFDSLPYGIKLFLKKDEFCEKISEIQINTSSSISFRKRFFDWFNMFRIVKFLNCVHTDFYKKEDIRISAFELLSEIDVINTERDATGLLLKFRQLEKVC